MAHIVRDKQKLIARVRRMRGQLDAIERALTEEQPCDEILRQTASCRGAMNGLMFELLEGQIRYHLAANVTDPASEEAQALEEVVDIVRAYLK
ncbi:MAG: metal/formaldehyde-sensitive transcriptional repressor [Dehalococcoidia bacterium]